MMPKTWLLGLCVTAAIFWFAFRHWEGSQERAALYDQGIARKVERIRTMAASATDSVHAEAELQYMMPDRTRCQC